MSAGELHFFRYTFEAAPYVSYGVLGPNGDLTASLDIGAANIKRPIMMHDFAITWNWVVFLDNPLCFDAEVRVHCTLCAAVAGFGKGCLLILANSQPGHWSAKKNKRYHNA
jgi:carotenoid cleavage dioxygenase-like enzyme